MPAQCGSFIALRRLGADNPFPSISLIKSVKMWQRSYFYVRNVATRGNWVNLPAFEAGPSAGRLPNWSYQARSLTPARAGAITRLRVLTQSEVLTGPDLLAAFVSRRVLPLQGHPHMISQMSGHRDPSRMCTKDMPHEEVAFMVNYLSDSRLLEDWRFGKEPYSRANPPPVVSRLSFLSLDCLLLA